VGMPAAVVRTCVSDRFLVVLVSGWGESGGESVRGGEPPTDCSGECTGAVGIGPPSPAVGTPRAVGSRSGRAAWGDQVAAAGCASAPASAGVGASNGTPLGAPAAPPAASARPADLPYGSTSGAGDFGSHWVRILLPSAPAPTAVPGRTGSKGRAG